MDYWHALTVPANTPESSPVREIMPVCPGVVKHVWLFFPQGHVGTTKVRILRYEHQVWPTTLEAWYLGDGTVIEFSEEYPVEGFPWEFIVEGYNTSASYPHTVYIRLTILPSVVAPALPIYLPVGVMY